MSEMVPHNTKFPASLKKAKSKAPISSLATKTLPAKDIETTIK